MLKIAQALKSPENRTWHVSMGKQTRWLQGSCTYCL